MLALGRDDARTPRSRARRPLITASIPFSVDSTHHKRMKQQIRLLFAVLLAMTLVAACETPSQPRQQTTVDRVLMKPNLKNRPYQRVLIVGAVPSRENARRIEIAVDREMSDRVETFRFVRDSDATSPTEEAVFELIQKHNIDGVLVVTGDVEGIENVKTEERTEFASDVQTGGQLGTFFRLDYRETVARAAGTVYLANIKLVSDFYDVESGDRVYSVQSSTRHGNYSHEIILAEGKAIARRLRQDGMVR